MKCNKCNREDTVFEVYLERKGFKDEYLHSLCCLCGGEVNEMSIN